MLQLIRVAIEGITDGAKKRFSGTGFAEQKLNGEFLQQYGFTSRPPSGSKGIAAQLPNGTYLLATADPTRYVEIADGEVCLHSKQNVKIHLKSDDSITIETCGAVRINSGEVNIGNGTQEKTLMAETFMKFFNSHTHIGNLGAPTSPPQASMNDLQLSTIVKNA